VKPKTKTPPASRTASVTHYFPVFLNLHGKKVVVIGGGQVAERKIHALLKVCKDITVISPAVTKMIERMGQSGEIKLMQRQYRKDDVRKAFLAVAATDSFNINQQVSRDAPCLVNVVDMPDLCNFIVPSVIKRGALTIAVSTSGISPALSKSIRKELERMYGPAFSEYLKSLKTIRAEAKKRIAEQNERSEFLKSVASEKMIKILREKGCKEAKKNAKDLLKKAKNSFC
jgi:precorrin-2 dehydrogenase/sirohydrochlorin ferrochelatase